jgi:hypothetical protein
MGNPPKAVAWAYATRAAAKGDAFHKTTAGGKMKVIGAEAKGGCRTSSADVKNPA